MNGPCPRTSWRTQAQILAGERDTMKRAWWDANFHRWVFLWLCAALLEERAATDERRQAA